MRIFGLQRRASEDSLSTHRIFATRDHANVSLQRLRFVFFKFLTDLSTNEAHDVNTKLGIKEYKRSASFCTKWNLLVFCQTAKRNLWGREKIQKTTWESWNRQSRVTNARQALVVGQTRPPHIIRQGTSTVETRGSKIFLVFFLKCTVMKGRNDGILNQTIHLPVGCNVGL